MSNRRILAFDIIKLFAIFLVLWGHCMQSLYPVVGCGRNKPVFLYIYSFHMPLFMMVSGYFSPSTMKLSFAEILQKKVKQLIVPAFVVSGLCVVTEYGICKLWGGTMNYFETFIYDIWFPKSLFLCFLLGALFFRIRSYSLWLALVFIFIVIHVRNFWGIAEMLPSFLFGHYIHNRKLCDNRLFLIYVASSCLIYLFLLQFWSDDYGTYIPFQLHKWIMHPSTYSMLGLEKELYRVSVGVTGAFFVFGILYILLNNHHSVIIARLAHIGQETLGIYFLQAIILERILKKVCTFGAYDINSFSFIIAPIVSGIVLILSFGIVKLIRKNYYLSTYFLGK